MSVCAGVHWDVDVVGVDFGFQPETMKKKFFLANLVHTEQSHHVTHAHHQHTLTFKTRPQHICV